MTKYNSEELWLLFQQVFSWFPLAAIIQNKIFCVHGGLSPLLNNVQTLRDLSLPIYNYLQNSMISDLVWSDPNDGIQGFHLNHRGSGQVFGPDTVDTFLRSNNLQLLIRGHQCTFSGFRPFANFEGVTLFSSSEYCMTFNNKCGVITFRNNEISFYCLQEDFDCDIMPQATMCLQVDGSPGLRKFARSYSNPIINVNPADDDKSTHESPKSMSRSTSVNKELLLTMN